MVRARGHGHSPVSWFVRHCLYFLSKGAEMDVSGEMQLLEKILKSSRKLVWHNDQPWAGAEVNNHVWKYLWQLGLDRHLADKKATPTLHGRNRSHLPTPSHQHVARTQNMTGNFLFLTLIATFTPPGSKSRAIPGSLQLLLAHSVPEQWPQCQQTGSNTEHPPWAMDLQGQNTFCGWLFISRIAQREFWGSGSTMYISNADRDAPIRQWGTKDCEKAEGEIKFCTMLFS